MKCCICGKEINGYGNNPFPLCTIDDHTSQCCNDCNATYVIQARIASMKLKPGMPKIGENIIIFYASDSDLPMKTIIEQDKYIKGTVTEEISENCFIGTWGNFKIDATNDSYMTEE